MSGFLAEQFYNKQEELIFKLTFNCSSYADCFGLDFLY